jgi:epoxyqueuosine reductase
LESFKQHEISQWIKARSSELGFFACGIAQAAVLEEDEIRLRQWLKNGYHADMGYMERNLDKRSDPRQLLPGDPLLLS